MDSDVNICELCEVAEGTLIKFHLDTGEDSALNDEAYVCPSCHISYPTDIEMFYVINSKRLNKIEIEEEEEFDEMDI